MAVTVIEGEGHLLITYFIMRSFVLSEIVMPCHITVSFFTPVR